MDIGLDSSVTEHLTSDAGVPGLIPGPATYLCICSFLPSLLHLGHDLPYSSPDGVNLCF